ncbi:MAG TPA: CoA transferase [Mycobacteriales bacterium]|nr:CoA transferase [Mycobacteriales bacterium]
MTGPLAGRVFDVPANGVSGDHAAATLIDFGAEVRRHPARPGTTALADWAGSGVLWLTGPADAPPIVGAGAPASATRGALLAVDQLARRRLGHGVALPDPRLLGERAALAARRRNAPWSVGGSFRAIACAAGWVGVSLARPSDLAALPAALERREIDDPWHELSAWAAGQAAPDVAERLQLLGIAAAVVAADPGYPVDDQARHRNRPVRWTHPANRHRASVGRPPLVVDLTSLWAGPLCGSLLAAAGATVIKVESATRPDGARVGDPALFDRLHRGQRLVSLDFTTTAGRDALRRLIESADLVLEASRPRAMQQLGVDPTAVVDGGTSWLSITAYGRSGPWSNRIGFGDDVAAAAGLVAWTDAGPVPVGDAIADPLAGVHAAAVAAAVLMDPDHAWLADVSMRDVAAAAARLPCEPAAVVAADQGWEVVVDGARIPVSPAAATRDGIGAR